MTTRIHDLNQNLDISGSLNHNDSMTLSNEPLKLGSLINSGICSISGTLVTGSFTDASLANFIKISSGIYKIIAYINPSTVQIDASLSFSNIAYEEFAPYSLEDDINYSRSDRALIKGTNYYSTPTYKRPTDTNSTVNVNLANIAYKTTDAKTILDTIKYSASLGAVNVFSIPVTKIANSVDITGVPIFDGYDSGNIISTFVEIYDSNWSSLKSTDGYFVYGRTKSSLIPNNVDVEIRKFDGINHNISYPYTLEQSISVIVYYPYRERLDLLDESFLRKRFLNTVNNNSSSGSGITELEHEKVRQLIHFIDEGPANGFLSGAYKETIGVPFCNQEIWWESSLKLKKIVEKNITRNSKKMPTNIQWLMYNSDGNLKNSITDTINYNGIFEQNRTRVIT